MGVKDASFAADFVYPFLVRSIPVYRLPEGICEIVSWLPAKLSTDKRGVNSITPVVSGSVGNILYHIVPFVKIFEYSGGNINVTYFIICTNVIDRPRSPS